MTHDPRFPDEDFEDEPIEVHVAENPGIVMQVRFDRDEFREISNEERATGQSSIELVRGYTLEAIRAKRREREAGQAEVAD